MVSIGIDSLSMYFAEPDAVRLVTPLLPRERRIVTRTAWSRRLDVRSHANDHRFILIGRGTDGENAAFRIRAQISCPLRKQIDRRFAKIVPHAPLAPRCPLGNLTISLQLIKNRLPAI
jgi:hypothetical protein